METKSSRVLSSLFYRNRAKKLSTAVSRDLYGDIIKGSVSRMELFNRCAYAHFAQHGLSLRERDIFASCAGHRRIIPCGIKENCGQAIA